MDRNMRERTWRERLARQAAGRLSVAVFCRREGVSTASFYYWRQRLRESAAGTPRFVPVRVTVPTAVEIVLGNGRVVRVPTGTDAGWLRELFAAAEGAPC